MMRRGVEFSMGMMLHRTAPIALIASAIWSAATATGSVWKLPPVRNSPVATMPLWVTALAVTLGQAGPTFLQVATDRNPGIAKYTPTDAE